jgi:hypothetical protein
MTSQLPAGVLAVQEELDRILSSRTFRDRESLKHLLKYLVQRTLDGTADGLKEYSIGLDVFGKPDGYDPQADPSVRVQIGRLRRRLEEYYQAEGASNALLFQLPKRHFSILVENRTLAVAEALAALSVGNSPRAIPWVRITHAAFTIVLAGLVLYLLFRGPSASGPPISPA